MGMLDKLGLNPHKSPKVNEYHLNKLDKKEAADEDARVEAGRQIDVWYASGDRVSLHTFVEGHKDFHDPLHNVATRASRLLKKLPAHPSSLSTPNRHFESNDPRRLPG